MSAAAATAPPGSWWRRRFVAPVVVQLRQGITPEKIAFTLALGSVLATFPILGSTSILCAIAGIALRLNQPVIQLVNWVCYPLQFALLIPLYRAGEALFGTPHLDLSIAQMVERFRAGPWQFLQDFGLIALGGIGVWVLAAPLVVGAIYYATRPPLRALARRTRAVAGEPRITGS